MPAATKAAATTPVSRNVADYRPGGSAAVAAGSGYRVAGWCCALQGGVKARAGGPPGPSVS
jgi:hypothetical protein